MFHFYPLTSIVIPIAFYSWKMIVNRYLEEGKSSTFISFMHIFYEKINISIAIITAVAKRSGKRQYWEERCVGWHTGHAEKESKGQDASE